MITSKLSSLVHHEYSKKKEGIVNENSKFFVNDYYSKFRIEIDNYSKNLIKKFKQKKISFTNLILFNHDSIYRNQKFIIPRIIIAIKEKNIKFLNNLVKEDIVMDFSHAEDICHGIEKIIFLKKNLKKIILSSGKSTKINDIIKFLIKKNKLNIKLNYKEKKNKCLIGDNKFAKRVLKWKPKKDIFMAAQEIFLNY